ncbi:hypothetical protein KAR91_03970 [Candidatus Pacearchaeota archaeon]|nr:hypothetical protein [Candidatus Pacearchaeota archaeon]
MDNKPTEWDEKSSDDIIDDIRNMVEFLGKQQEPPPITTGVKYIDPGVFKITYRVTKSGMFYRCPRCKKLFPSSERRVATIHIHEELECE